jgi:hemerythrin-like domain-containing protein
MSISPGKAKPVSAVTKKLVSDHHDMIQLMDRLLLSLQDICQQQASQSLNEARALAEELVQRMNVHAACEDQVIFPALSKYHPIPILEIEHEEVLLQRAAVVTGILNYTFPEDCNEKLLNQAAAFVDLVKRHFAKEEKAVFPLLERSLSSSEKHQVMARMEDILAKSRVIPIESSGPISKIYLQFRFPMDEPVTHHLHTDALLETPNFQLKGWELQAGASLATHWTPMKAMILLVAGKAQWIGPDSTVELSAGDGIYMDAKLSHSLKAHTDCRFLLFLQKE